MRDRLEIKNGKLGAMLKDLHLSGITPEFWVRAMRSATATIGRVEVVNCGKKPGQTAR
jgi:hypothetical protein